MSDHCVTARRLNKLQFVIYLFLVAVGAPNAIGDESSQQLQEDLFSGLVTGQQERIAHRLQVAQEQSPRPVQPLLRVVRTDVETESGPSLFTLHGGLAAAAKESPRSSSRRLSTRNSSRAASSSDTNQKSLATQDREVEVPAGATTRALLAPPSGARVIDIPSRMDLMSMNDTDVVIDGHLDEADWHKIPGFENMIVVDPDTLVDPEFPTLVRIFYTDAGLFVSAEMTQPSDSLVQRLSARDQNLNRDGFTITLDTSGKGLFGFWFALNLGGAKEDGKVLPERNFSREWDGAWQGATAVTANGWSAEMFIPWSIVAMPPGDGARQMNFFVSRKVAFRNERYGWPALPFTSARFMSALQPMEMQDVNPKQQWEVFPYASTSADGIYDETNGKVGMNFSWRPAPNMQITGAVNPDFGAVESDDVVVNLTAYETFFPEKRLFFLEGSEVFETSPRAARMRGSSGGGARRAPSTYTMEPTTLLNTRRIGGSAKQVDVPDDVDVPGPEMSKPTDLLAAVKVVGQSNAFRYGVLGAVEDDVELRGTLDETGEDVLVLSEGRNFGITRLMWERQAGTGRQAHGYINTFANTPEYDAMVHGIDSHFLTQNGKWSIDTQLVNSIKDSEEGYGAYADLRYTPKQGEFHRFSFDFLDDTLDISDLGFLRRNDVRGMRYTRFSNTSVGLPDFLRSRSIGLFVAGQQNADGDLINGYLGTMIRLNLKDQSAIEFNYSFQPKQVDDRSSYGNGSYRIEPTNFITLTYATDSSKKFSYSLQGGMQESELGDPMYFGDIGFTYSPGIETAI